MAYWISELLILLIVNASTCGYPQCRWPCSWKIKQRWYMNNDTTWTVISPSTSVFFNMSKPVGQRRTIHRCIQSDGDFFVFKKYDVFYCCKLFPLSDDFWYAYCGPAQPGVVPGLQFTYKGCNRPHQCPPTDDSEQQCTGKEYSESLGNGTECEET